jgi:photosystem II stability/assembly factor-like uncharacterized protein
MIALSGDLTSGRVPGNVPYGTITSISESPKRFGLIYVGTDDGNVQRSLDGGYSFEKLNETTPAVKSKKAPEVSMIDTRGLWVSRLTASAHTEGRVYMSLNGYRFDDFLPYLYVSEDHGKTWMPCSGDLPFEPINVVREDSVDPDILYVGTDGGVYVSFDRGQSFMAWRSGLPKSVPVHDIAIQSRDNEIVLGTHGRSLYVAKLDDVQKIKKDPDWMKKKPAPKKEKERNWEED